jgi:hypothetical protein
MLDRFQPTVNQETTMSKEHVSEQYVKQIEASAKAFETAMKLLNGEVVQSVKWKAQLAKTKVADEHFEVLVKGFEEEYKKEKTPDSKLKDLHNRVMKAEKHISTDTELVKKLK